MFSEKVILMFMGLLEQIKDQRLLLSIANELDPDMGRKLSPDYRIITNYFKQQNRMYDWINAVLKKLVSMNSHGIRKFLHELENDNKCYNHHLKRIEALDKFRRSQIGWGLLKENDYVYVALAEFNLEGSFGSKVTECKSYFSYIIPHINSFGGRIWDRRDEKITAGFFLGDKVNNCVEACLDVLLNTAYYNLFENMTDDLADIKITCASGFINFSSRTTNIYGHAVDTLDKIASYSEFNTIVIPDSIYSQMEEFRRDKFSFIESAKPESVYKFSFTIGEEKCIM